MGRSARWPSPRATRYQATPNMTTASATRSVTESKNAPRTEAVPAALATGPSSRSCRPVTISSDDGPVQVARGHEDGRGRRREEAGRREHVSGDAMAVQCLSRPDRWSDRPPLRQRPSNIRCDSLSCAGLRKGGAAVRASLPSGRQSGLGGHVAGSPEAVRRIGAVSLVRSVPAVGAASDGSSVAALPA